MRIVYARPPNYAELNAAFKIAGKPVIVTYGDTVYCLPGVGQLTAWLRAHEAVHIQRQNKETPEAWWARYLVDAEFRLREELPAHRAEFGTFCSLNKDRSVRSQFLTALAERLSSPLYGGLLSKANAKVEITK